MFFVPELSALAAFSLASAVLALTPGPDMTYFLGKAVVAGRRAGFVAMAGAFFGILIHTLFVAIGLSALLAASATAFSVLKVVGALYLLWLAISVLRTGSGFRLDDATPKRESVKRVFLSGLGINILNPKIILFFVTFLPQFVSVGDPNAAAKLVFLGLWFLVIGGVIIMPMIYFADRIALRLRRSPRILRAIDWLFAGIMAGFAVRLALARAD